jgi:hypothetical protein
MATVAPRIPKNSLVPFMPPISVVRVPICTRRTSPADRRSRPGIPFSLFPIRFMCATIVSADETPMRFVPIST